MMDGSGMVAVVTSLRDAGLTVTLLDKGRQYTLCPRSAIETHLPLTNPGISQPYRGAVHHASPERSCPKVSTGVLTDNASGYKQDSAVQAVDDRYASVYQMTHCRIKPTSPSYQCTEFPPQPAQLNPGQGNFVVGGAGSGDAMYKPVRARQYRGGMVWTERGSVFAPRPSRAPDAFVSSLRRYPSMSPERSTEIVERLINYTQGKGFGRSPTRYGTRGCGTDSSSQRLRSPSPLRRHEDPTRDTPKSERSFNENVKQCGNTYRKEKERRSLEDRDRDREPRKERKSTFFNEYDVRYMKSPRRQWKQNACDVPYNQPVRCSTQDNYTSSNKINTEVQVVPTSNREVSTSMKDRSNFNSHNAASPASPVVSGVSPQEPSEEDPVTNLHQSEQSSSVLINRSQHDNDNESEEKSRESTKRPKNFQRFACYTSTPIIPKLKMTQSSIDMITTDTNECKAVRKTRSQTDRLNSSKEEIEEWLRKICNINKTRKMCAQLQRLADNLKKPGAEQKLRDKIDKYIKKIPTYFSEGDKEGKAFRQQLPQQIIRKLKSLHDSPFNTTYNLYRFEVPNFYLRDDTIQFKIVIKNWLKPLNIDKERLDRDRNVKKEDIYNFLVYRLEPFVLHKRSNPEYKKLLKSYVLNIVNDLPITVEGEKKEYIDKISENLTGNLFKLNLDRSRKNTTVRKAKSTLRLKKSYKTFKRYNYAKKIKEFIAIKLTKLVKNKVLCVNKKRLICIEMELRDLLLNIIDSKESNIDVNKCILLLLMHIGKLSKEQAKETSDNIINDFRKLYENITGETKDFSQKSDNISKFYTENCSVYHCEGRKNVDDSKHLKPTNTYCIDTYVQKVENVIKTWLNDIGIICNQTENKVAIKDLAGDIADRKKYLQINSPKTPSQKDEVKNLKYQIFKWLGNVVGGNDFDIKERASELMVRIDGIPPPVVREPKKLFSDEVMNLFREHLYEEIYDWFYDEYRSVGDSKSKKVVQNLVNRITQDKEKGDIQKRINVVVDTWNTEVLKGITENKMTKTLKDKIKALVDSFIEYEEKEISRPEKTEVSIQIDSPQYNIATNTEITEEMIEEDFNKYVLELENQISQWLKDVGAVKINKNPLKEVAIRDLAWDIIERYKYVKLNPSSKGSSEEEVEILKYQVYKCIKNLDKSELRPTLQKVDYLISRIKQISPPIHDAGTYNNDSIAYEFRSPSILTGSGTSNESKESEQLKWQIQANSRAQMAGGILIDPSMNECLAISTSLGTMIGKDLYNTNLSTINEVSVSNNSSCYCKTGNIVDDDKQYEVPKNCKGYKTALNIKQDTAFDQANRLARPICDYTSSSYCNVNSLVTDEFDINAIKKLPTSIASNIHFDGNITGMNLKIDDSESEYYYLPNNMTVYETYQYFDKIFKEKCAELPIVAVNKEQEALAKLAKQGVYNGIWKIYFKYKSNPETVYNYSLFENKVEEQLDFMLNRLPHSPEIIKDRNDWKRNIISLTSLMLRFIHSLSDHPSYRKILAKKFSKQFIKNQYIEDDKYYSVIDRVAKCYIVYTSFRFDLMRASIYRQRLIDILQEFASYMKANFDEYKNVRNEHLCQEAFDILFNIPFPSEDIINHEAKVILIEDEIKLWYLELPTKRIANITDELIRARMKEILAKNLHRIEINSLDDDYKNDKWRQEILRFLQKDAKLRQDYFNTDFMVDTLISRLNNLHRSWYSNYVAHNRRISNNSGIGRYHIFRTITEDNARNDLRIPICNRMLLTNGRFRDLPKKWQHLIERRSRRRRLFQRLKYCAAYRPN